MKNSKRIYKMVILALFCAIEVILAVTPLGYIPIGPVRATTLHLPVILAGILFGPKEGAFLGAFFGLTSLCINTFSPTPASFLFSPFYSFGELSGGFGSLLICFIPRIAIGVVSSYIYQLGKKKLWTLPVSAIVGSLCNTCLVLGGIYLFFKDSYAAMREISTDAVAGVLLAQLSVNGILEALVAAIGITILAKALLKIIPQ